MINIEMSKELKMDKVLSYRAKLSQSQLNIELKNIEKYLEDEGIKKSGPSATTSFNIEVINGEHILDTEVLIPLDTEIVPIEKYSFKSKIRLRNAIKSTYVGNPQYIGNHITQMMDFIVENKWIQLTTVYCVNMSENSRLNAVDSMEVDIYIGVNNSIL